ncbi:anti-phage dCTP deaminase [Aminobacter sp. NyZ550]|uniref:anti-phage dCTP deaminase n=1 Tax=Aminobacter sp. NyZ550 TaxID=2979870 RepID=UPI0021D5FA61|nr:anti-phage dCTP deaminase [Aminobacter sp. NyZ550]WAX95572.1 anti-phage dCTP deaminase [Aminobacter sp. NyZ550]
MGQAATILSNDNKDGDRVANSISDRLSQELVIALVGPVASGVSTTARYLKDILTQKFQYDVPEIIKPSTIIKAEAHRVKVKVDSSRKLSDYIGEMQDAGNDLRARFGGDYLAEKSVEQIVKHRRKVGGYRGELLMPGRRAYIIDSLKNTEELDLLRTIYGETLCVFGVFAPDDIRKLRLINDGVDEAEVNKIINRDQNEVATFGQKTRKIFVEADFFLCNDQKKEELQSRVDRLLDIIFNTSIRTPTRAESAMYEATSAASNSGCMSRQVGAAIVSNSGELISVGWNDVPKYGGSLYSEDDQSTWSSDNKRMEDNDHRCFKWAQRICHNETRRTSIVDGIIDRIMSSGFIRKDAKRTDVAKLLSGTAVDDLIEFSRSIHAEMDAILAVAREGKHSLVGSTLYTNTYPCHNCARHIVAAGIRSVVYIQPYRKSLATALHADSVSENPNDKTKVVFRQFDGVAPRNYLRLFQQKNDRKRDGKVISVDHKSAIPVFRMALDSPAEYESKVIADLTDKEQTLVG